MVGTENLWPDPEYLAWQLQSSSPMNASLEIKQKESMPMCIKSGNYLLSKRVEIQGFAIPLCPSLKVEEENVVHGSHHCLSTLFQNSLCSPRAHQKEKESLHSAGPSVMPVPKSNIESYPKSFLIFDQSGKQKRSMYTSVSPLFNTPSTVPENNRHYGYVEEEWAAREVNTVNYFPQTLSKENQVASKESEMHEDTEEIDALLYSDDDSIGSECGSDDEVTSTGRSPELINECYDENEQVCQETAIEIACTEGLRKRQRLDDGGYKKLPVISTEVTESPKVANDSKSSYGIDNEEGDELDFHFCSLSPKKDRIKETMEVLESIVPGAKGKDPLLLIDEAIDYLKSLKHEATALGVSCY